MISRVANTLVQISPQHSLRVAIDGITAVGKMTFADKLAEDVAACGRPCVRVSMEDFRQPSAVRFSRGRDSVEGYYENAYDYGALRSELLHPLGPTGNGSYRCAVYDLATDQRIDAPTQSSVPGLIVIVDGSFLQRRELANGWDVVVFLRVSFASARARGVARDAPRLGSIKDALRLYDTRYDPAQRRYLSEVDPETTADVVVDHDDPQSPSIVRIAADLGLVEAHLRRTCGFFGPRAEKWEKRFPDDGAAYRDAIAELGPKRGGVVVDLGCGTGRALPFLRSAIGVEGVVVGVDVTPEMLQAACHEGRDHDAQLVLADVMRLPILAESVDSFFVAGLLSHVPDSHHLLRSMARAAKPTGRLALGSSVGRAEQAHRRNRLLRPDEVLDPQVLPGLLAATGWTVKRIDDCEQRYLALASKAT